MLNSINHSLSRNPSDPQQGRNQQILLKESLLDVGSCHARSKALKPVMLKSLTWLHQQTKGL